MLADGVEASVRSLASRDEPAIRAMVARIIEERIADGQFDECDLTLRDIERIREAFVGAAARDVPPADRLPAEQGRRARVAARGRRRRAAGGVTPADLPRPVADRRHASATASRAAGRRSRALARAIAAALDAAGAPSPASIGLILSDDAELAALNADHMGHDGPTDVLSFPLLPPEAFPPHPGEPTAASAGRGRRRSPCRPAGGRTSATSSSRSSGRSSRRPRAAAARPATSAGRRPTSCACS